MSIFIFDELQIAGLIALFIALAICIPLTMWGGWLGVVATAATFIIGVLGVVAAVHDVVMPGEASRLGAEIAAMLIVAFCGILLSFPACTLVGRIRGMKL